MGSVLPMRVRSALQRDFLSGTKGESTMKKPANIIRTREERKVYKTEQRAKAQRREVLRQTEFVEEMRMMGGVIRLRPGR